MGRKLASHAIPKVTQGCLLFTQFTNAMADKIELRAVERFVIRTKMDEQTESDRKKYAKKQKRKKLPKGIEEHT